MAEWEVQSNVWITRCEWITDIVFMMCCKRPVPYHNTLGTINYGHVYVFDKDYREHHNYVILDHFEFIEDAPLEIECVAHEMRKKYKSP